MKKDNFYKISYALLATKTFNANQKLLLATMLSDYELNNHINWSQSKYADKIASSRDFVTKFFNYLEFAGILTRLDENRSKRTYNRYNMEVDLLEMYINDNDVEKFKSVVSNYKLHKKKCSPELQEVQSQTTGSVVSNYRECSPELQGVQSETTQHRYLNRYLNRKQIDSKIEEVDSAASLGSASVNSSVEDEVKLKDGDEIEAFLRELDI